MKYIICIDLECANEARVCGDNKRAKRTLGRGRGWRARRACDPITCRGAGEWGGVVYNVP